MARRTRRDANHAQVVADLRARGYAVTDLAAVGDGVADIALSKGGVLRFVEIKNAATRPTKSRGVSNAAKLARQAAFAARHEGCVIVAMCADEVDSAWPTR